MVDFRHRVKRMPTDGSPKITVVMAVFNEISTIAEILLRVQAVDLDKEIIIVDDASTDGTREFLQALSESTKAIPAQLTLRECRGILRADNIRVLFQSRNRGKGAALRLGFQEVRGDIVITQDADLENDPADYHKLIAPIEAGRADVVYGSRFLGGRHRFLSFWHYFGNKLLTGIANTVTNLELSDVCTCYKAIARGVLQTLDLREEGFGIDSEIAVKIARGGWRICETPISYRVRTYQEGKKITWWDGIRAVWCILSYGLLGASAKAPRDTTVVGSINPENKGTSAR